MLSVTLFKMFQASNHFILVSTFLPLFAQNSLFPHQNFKYTFLKINLWRNSTSSKKTPKTFIFRGGDFDS